MTRILTCIVCPMGCEIKVNMSDGKIVSVDGNTCARGHEYAVNECTAPVRTLTTTVALSDGRVLAVKTNRPVPKQTLFECMKIINSVTAPLTTKAGDVIISNILNTGADVVAVRDAED